MAKSKRRAKRSGRTKVAGAVIGAGHTAPTSGLKDVRPPEPNWDDIGREAFGVPGLDEESVRYVLDHQEDKQCQKILSKLGAYLKQQEQSESDSQNMSDSQSNSDSQTSDPASSKRSTATSKRPSRC